MILNVLKAFFSPFLSPPGLQVAAVCHRRRSGATEVLMVKSLDSGRWIVPKGWPMRGKSLAEAAATEAWEEAGVKGVLNPVSIGTYHYSKQQAGGVRLRVRVHVFEIAVETLADVYPESGKRKRFWAAPFAASQKVKEPELRAILQSFAGK